MLNEKKVNDSQMKAVQEQMELAGGNGKNYGSITEMYDDIARMYIESQGHVMGLMELREKKFSIMGEILKMIDQAVAQHNKENKACKWTSPKTLPATVVAKLIIASDEVYLIQLSNISTMTKMAVTDYNPDGTRSGISLLDMNDKQRVGGPVRAEIRSLMGAEASDKAVESCRSAIKEWLEKYGEIYPEGWNKDFIVLNNGVYNGLTKEFTAYTDPDYMEKYGKYKFLSKMDTDWNPLAKEPDYFKVLEFLRSVMPDGEKGDAQFKQLRHMIQFLFRRYPGKTGWMVEFLNDLGRSVGRGGKSTLWEFILGAIEHFACDSYRGTKFTGHTNGAKVIKAVINDWNGKHELAHSIIGAYAVYSDERRCGAIDQDAVKHFARNQSHTFEPKFEAPFSYVMHGTAGLSDNGAPMYMDKSDAMYAHQKIFMTDKHFDPQKGTGDPNVKTKYICEEETWEWLVYYIATEVEWLEDYPEDETGTMDENVRHLKEANVPTFGILDDVMAGLKMCPRVPGEWVHHLYRNACEDNNIDYILNMNQFWKDMVAWVAEHSDEYEIVDMTTRKNDTIKRAKAYTIKGSDGQLEQVSEWDILFNHVHPSVVAYGHASKQFGQSKYVLYKDGFTAKGQVFGCFDEKAGLAKYSHFIRIKNPLQSYEEYLSSDKEDAETAEKFASQMRKQEQAANAYKRDVRTENETNYDAYDEQQKLIASMG